MRELAADGVVFAQNELPTLSYDKVVEWLMSKLNYTREQVAEMTDAAKTRAFDVAWESDMSLVQRIKEMMASAISSGQTFEDWHETVTGPEGTLAGIGVTHEDPSTGEQVPGLAHWHAEVNFRTNLSNSFNGAQKAQVEEPGVAEHFWGYEYHAIMDDRVSAICAALDGKVYPINDPFWDTYYPPNHWQCRSRVRPILRTEAERRGLVPSPPTTTMVNQAGDTVPLQPGDEFGSAPDTRGQ